MGWLRREEEASIERLLGQPVVATHPRTVTDNYARPRIFIPSERWQLSHSVSHSAARKRSTSASPLTRQNSPRSALPLVRGSISMVGDTGFEPVTSSVSSIPAPCMDVLGRPDEHAPVPQRPSTSARTRPRCQAGSQAGPSPPSRRLELAPSVEDHFAGSKAELRATDGDRRPGRSRHALGHDRALRRPD